MSTDLQLKSSCSGCGSTTDLYGSNCKHMTLCLGCGKTMADKRAKCVDCGATLTRLIREYNVRASSPIDKNYFIGRFINGLPDFSKKKSAENKWSLQKDGLHGRQITDTLREKYKNKPWLLEDESGQSQFQGHLEGSQSATYYLLMKERKEFVAIPAGSWYNFNKVAQYKQLTLEEAEEKMKNRKKTADGYQRWMMKAANNGPAAFGEHGEFDDKESYTGGGRSHKKTSEDDEGHVSVKGEEDEEVESERKSRLGLNKRSGDDDEEGPRGGDHDLDDDDVEKALNKEMAMNVPKIIPDMSKLEPLDGTNYRRWSQKLLILFEALEVDYVLSKDPLATPVVTPLSGGTKKADEEVKKKYEKDNKTVRGHLLIHMANNLFDLFINQKSAKVIWDTLLKRYGDDDAGKRKYVVGNWLRFQMLDDKPIMEQVHEYENLVGDILNEGMKICEILQANVLLEKFPPSWSDYRNQLKHKKRDLSLQELINHMKIEEANRLQDKHVLFSKNSVNANVVEISDQNRFKGKGKEKKFQKNGQHKNHTGINRGDNKIQKKKLVCYVCGKPGHKAYQCYMRQGQQNQNQKPLVPFAPQAHLVENEEVIAAMVVEANLVDNKVDWILDTGASKHLCANKELFHHFEDAANGECVFMGNSATARVLGDDREHEEIFTDDDEAVGNDPEEREDLAPEVPAPPEIKQDEEEEEDGDNEEGEGLSKSGKELKKLLGKASGLNESDAEDDDDDDDDVDDDVGVPPVIATKQKDALKEEPIDNSPSKPTATGPARGTPSSKSSKGKRKLNEEAKPSNTATPRKEPKLSAKDVNGYASKSGAPPKGTPPLSSKGGSSTTTTASGPVSEEEIRAVLRQKTPVTTQDLVAKFKARLRCSEDKQAFAEILKRISKIQKTTTGASYVILRDK